MVENAGQTTARNVEKPCSIEGPCLRGKAVLITGGTMGIGLATGLAFAREGACCTLTHKWGTADESAIYRLFEQEGLHPPVIVQADASHPEDTARVIEEIGKTHGEIEVFVSNVSVAQVVRSLGDYDKRSLFRSIEYSVWPMFEYPQAMHRAFGRYPRYIIGLSSGGPDHYYKNYDFVAASKAVMETLCRYLNYRLFDQDVRINIVRSRLVRTESLRATFGREFEAFTEKLNMDTHYVEPSEVAGAILALCSGLMDGVSGQVLTVDHGATFFDNTMRLYNERACLNL
jgi:NAD(P)-dependent dehydrogenase (short-subunit alcohol dehydrogenase family)